MKYRKHNRRQGALDRLETQLVSGKKHEKISGKTTNKKVSLTEKDTKRIKRDIKTLEDKLKEIKI